MKINNSYIKGMYNSDIKKKYKNNYEFNRWFSNTHSYLDYYMSYKSIKHKVKKIDIKSCFELGPGPGTWTKLIYRIHPKCKFKLIDISKSMKEQFLLEMRDQSNIDYEVCDFNSYKFNENYDLFFSSRAIEYIEKKEELIKKMYEILNEKGKGIIITKNENYCFPKIIQKFKKRRLQHSEILDKKMIKKILINNGFKNVKFYPSIIRFPYGLFYNLSKFIWQKTYKKEILGFHWLSPITESFIITFDK